MPSISYYEIGAQLGRGSQGVVYRAKRKADGKLVAIKKVFVQRMSRKEQMEAANEIRALKAVDHPYVIRYLDSFQEDTTLCIVTELAEVCGLLLAAVGCADDPDHNFNRFRGAI
jgi:serine/threonine protein kinase